LVDEPTSVSGDDADEVFLTDVQNKLSFKAGNISCPFCSNTKWYLMDKPEVTSIIPLVNSGAYPVYSFACTNCGFVRQHSRPIVDGQLPAETSFVIAHPG
jgi:C4-type Zn-finger protein